VPRRILEIFTELSRLASGDEQASGKFC